MYSIRNIGALAIAAVFVGLILTASVTMRSHVSLRLLGIEAYADQGGTIPLTEIQWGLIGVGESKNYTLWVKPTGNVDVTLDLSTGNFDPPEAEQYTDLVWDYIPSTVVPAGQLTELTLTITIIPTPPGYIDFSYDTIITATEI